jgi:parallel beta-helix repeat protein
MLARLAAATVLVLTAAGCGVGSGAGDISTPSPDGGSGPPVLYVDARSGRDGNDGHSATSALKTLNKAASMVKPGWTVLATDGTYTSDGTIAPLELTVSGTKDAWITFAAAPGSHPVIQIPRGPGAFAGIHLAGVAYVVIDGFEVIGQNGSITQQEAAPNDGTQAVLNENCIFIDGQGYKDFHPDVPHDIVIRNSVLHGCSAGGIQANVADALVIEKNRVYDNAWWTVFGASGIVLYHLTDAPGAGSTNGYKNVIVKNEVYGNKNNMPSLPVEKDLPRAIYDGNGIIVDDSMHTQPALGTHDLRNVAYTGRTYVANNVVHDNGGRGIHVYESTRVDVVNNTTYDNLLSSSQYIDSGEIDAYSCTEVNILNNVAVNLVRKDVNTRDGNNYDYNVWDAYSVPSKGPNDVIGAAKLANPRAGDYSPAAGSPALRSGTGTLAPTDDFFGNPRPSGAIDRGAIQVSK